jgi:hypothetical protein
MAPHRNSISVVSEATRTEPRTWAHCLQFPCRADSVLCNYRVLRRHVQLSLRCSRIAMQDRVTLFPHYAVTHSRKHIQHSHLRHAHPFHNPPLILPLTASPPIPSPIVTPMTFMLQSVKHRPIDFHCTKEHSYSVSLHRQTRCFVPYFITMPCTILHGAALLYDLLRCIAAPPLHCLTALHCAVTHCATLHCHAQHCIAMCHTTQFRAKRRCSTPQYTVPHRTVL